MDSSKLSSLLSSLTGHLQVRSQAEEEQIGVLRKMMADSLQEQDEKTVLGRNFSIARTDFLGENAIPEQRKTLIGNIVKQSVSGRREFRNTRFYRRDTPLISDLLAGSVPEWAAGAQAARTFGPYLEKDGRMVWFDMYKILEKPVRIYMEGEPNPLLLFTRIIPTLRPPVRPGPVRPLGVSYTIAAGSVWINARILNPTAPANQYCGLKVKGGSITFPVAPLVAGENYTIKPAAKVKVQLDLEDNLPADAPGSGNYGADARDQKLRFPAKFSFSFTGFSHSFTDIKDAGWKVFGKEYVLQWKNLQDTVYVPGQHKILITLESVQNTFEVQQCLSPFQKTEGPAPVKNAFWGLATAALDVLNPLEAGGNGSLILHCGKGLSTKWSGLENRALNLQSPWVLGEPGLLGILDFTSEGTGARQTFELWKDDLNPNGCTVELDFLPAALYLYFSVAAGTEVVYTGCNADFRIDRPVKVNGEPFAVQSKNSFLMIGVTETFRLIFLYDDNILWDNKLPDEKIPKVTPAAIALENALLTVTPVNGCLLFGMLDPLLKKVTDGKLWLVFGLYHYIPTLPDPYAANLQILKRLTGNTVTHAEAVRLTVILRLSCLVSFKAISPEKEGVEVSFYFGQNAPNNYTSGFYNESEEIVVRAEVVKPDYEKAWEEKFGRVGNDLFSLLDVSTNASLFGISFGLFGGRKLSMVTTAVAVTTNATAGAGQSVPLIIEGLDVKSQGSNVRAFTLPQVAWEPVINLSPPGSGIAGDPPFGVNYYPNDGGPSRIVNNSQALVPLAPLPLIEFLVNEYKNKPDNKTFAQFTLPFGIKAIAQVSRLTEETVKPDIQNKQPKFRTDLQGGVQIRLIAGNYGKIDPVDPRLNDSNMFPGFTIQLNNINNLAGLPTGTSTLGDSVAAIFNYNFFSYPLSISDLFENSRGVPLERIDFSGYGASIFSNWLSPSAQFAETSQSRFDVIMGRTSHEVIQVKSVLYPWGIRVVRTITLFRVASGYVYRVDSGWKAESDGVFDFRYSIIKGTIKEVKTPFEIHPGVVRGLFNVRNIREDGNLAEFHDTATIYKGSTYIDPEGREKIWDKDEPLDVSARCRGVWFDADVEVENVVQGHVNKRVVSTKVMGYVQLAPQGIPLTPDQFTNLLKLQGGKIGGNLDCIVDINKSKMQMRVSGYDMNISVNKTGNPVFVAAVRGNILLPKDGSWSVVMHNTGTGDVTPLPETSPVPLIREGIWDPLKVVPPSSETGRLLRIAHPLEILRNAQSETNNFGFLQSTGSQKALFLTPSFGRNVEKILSKTPPVFADAFRLMTGNGIFPNIGDAVTNFGKALPMLTGKDSIGNVVNAFTQNALQDGATKVLELMEVTSDPAGSVAKGLQLLQKGAGGMIDKALKFDIPDFDIPLVEMDGLKIYLEYKTKNKDGSSLVKSLLNFDVDSFASADPWKSRMDNLSVVVDLGSMKRLMTVKGNFDSRKGKESAIEGDPNGISGLPVPEIEFSDDLQPVIDILELLAQLSTGDYGKALQTGLKLAMSNAGEIWEYKFEAGKDIPLIKFPPEPAYSSAQTPLKLDASLGLGFYFNAALKVTTDPSKLLPTAGAFLKFHGGLTVMCTSVGAISVFAKGSVDVKIACDTSKGPSLALKFGFGVELVASIPVIGSVSLLFMVGIEMYADTGTLSITAFLYFRGNAEILGGIVSITITIEAKGTIKAIAGPPKKTDCEASVTFGLDISIFLIINISFTETWSESRQIA